MNKKLTFVNGAKAGCGCRHEFSSGGGEYSDVASVHLCAMHAGTPVLDDRWKARMLDGRAPERDEMGLGDHPDLPWLDEGMMPRSFFAALGLELAHTMAENQLDADALEAMSEAVNWTDWQPTSPQGDGWKLISIFDTEEGPVAWWLRELPEAEDGTTTIRILQAEVEKLKARIARAGAAPAAVAPQGERQWICPTRTVADLVNNLLTMDQGLPVYGAQYIEKDGRRCAIAVPPTVSRERVKDGRWIGQGEELNAAVIWTRAERPAAVAGSALDVTLDEDQAGLLRDMLGDHAEYPEAITVRLLVGDGHSGHGLYVAQAEYQDEGAVLLTSLPAPAAPALEAPAAPADEHAAFQADYLRWCPGKQGRLGRDGAGDRSGYSHAMVQARWLGWSARAALAAAPQAPAKGLPYEPTSDMLIAGRECDPALPIETIRAIWWAMCRTAPQAPAAPVGLPAQGDPAALLQLADVLESGRSLIHTERKEAADALRLQATAAKAAPATPSAVATQVIENLLQLARIVNTAVEDWGETKEDDSLEVIFHKDVADKMEAILEFFDSLPDAPAEEGVIESGPLRAARVLRAMEAPAAPAVDASDSALLDAMERERIAVIPEFEGPWDAQIFGEDETTLACGSGTTPRKAIAEALASLEARKAHDAAQAAPQARHCIWASAAPVDPR